MASNTSWNMKSSSHNFSILLSEWVLPMSLFSILCVTALIVNGFLLIVIWKDPMKCLRTRPTFLITNLMTADFVGALSNITRISFRYFLEEFGTGERHYFEKPVIVMGFVALLVSYTTVFLISMEHLGAIASPIRFKVMATNRVIAWTIGITWLVCTAVIIPLYTIPNNHQVFQAITAIHSLMLITLPTSYTYAYLSLKRQLKKRNVMADSSQRDALSKQKRILQQKNFLVTSAGIVLFSLITCAPFIVHNYEQFLDNRHYNLYRNSDMLGMVFWIILNLNLCADPFIYCLRTAQYRNSCAVLLCGIRRRI